VYGGGQEVGYVVFEDRSGSSTITRFLRIHRNSWRGRHALRRATPSTSIVKGRYETACSA
jgi:hypothetical protein